MFAIPSIAIVFPFESSAATLELRGVDSPRTAKQLAAWIAADRELHAAFMAGLLAAQPRAAGMDADAFTAIVAQLGPEMITTPEQVAVVFHTLLGYADGCAGCDLVLPMMQAVEWASASGGDRVCHAFSRGAEVSLCGVDAGQVPARLHHVDECPRQHTSCAACGSALWAVAHAKAGAA